MTEREKPSPLRSALARLATGRRLGETLAGEAFAEVMRGAAAPSQIGALLMGLRVQGEGEDEVTGIVRALRAAMLQVEVDDRTHLIDTCGTGGGGISTFNISTAAALVAMAGGAQVAKHGNRSYTSRCGSADLLEALGVSLTVSPERAAELLRTVGMAFLYAPSFHPAAREVTPIRRELAVPTIMNLIGPLANPANVARQVLGVWDVSRASLVAGVLRRLGAEHALVLHARVGMDELSPVGKTDVWEVRDGQVDQYAVDPADYGVTVQNLAGLAGGDPEANARRVERLLSEPAGDPEGRAAVGLNAGAALYVAGIAPTLAEGIENAFAVLDHGRGATALADLRHETAVSTSE